jgi:D-3-phosphoglycerate dehydrogenase
MYRIIVTDKLGDAGLERLNQAEDIEYDIKLQLEKEELLATISEYDAIIVRSGTKVDADLIAAGTNLRVIGRAGIGVDNIDISAASARGIIVMNTPQANAVATAEQALALMLGVSRHTAVAHASLLAGEWRRSEFIGQQLYRKVLGIIGFGRIGRIVAKRALSLGMEILAFDPFVSEEIAKEHGVLLVDLDDLLSQADYITLHTTITPETREIINTGTIAKMKDGVILVNSARGGLINEAALAAALKNGKIAAAAIDVYSQEPPKDNPLIGLPNVLHTPHLGASTVEAQRDVATQIADQVLDALRGIDFRNTVNMPFHAGPDFATLAPHMLLAEKMGILQWVMAPAPIRKVELEVRGEMADRLIRPAAAALLKGLLERSVSDSVNYINAPVLAEENGLKISQTKGLNVVDYPNLISCRVHWQDGQRLLSGVLFGGSEPRLVQIDDYRIDVSPEGTILIMQSRDMPGVIGKIGSILAENEVNIGEWRMGRTSSGGEALSFISLDNEPSEETVAAIREVPAVKNADLIKL